MSRTFEVRTWTRLQDLGSGREPLGLTRMAHQFSHGVDSGASPMGWMGMGVAFDPD